MNVVGQYLYASSDQSFLTGFSASPADHFLPYNPASLGYPSMRRASWR